MATLLQDLRHALRGFARTRTFTAVSIGTLSLGIGATTAIFSLANAVLLAPLGFTNERQLVRITSDLSGPGLRDAGVAVPELADYRGEPGLFSSLAGFWRINANLTGDGIDAPERVEGLIVSPEYFQLLGARPETGRLFGPQDSTPGIADVAVISHSLWTRLFGADPAAVGQTIRLDTDIFTIIGVLPEDFRHHGRGLEGPPVVFAPSQFVGAQFGTPSRANPRLDAAIGRLEPGVTPDAAQLAISRLGNSLRAAYPADYDARGWQPRVESLRDAMVGGVRPSVLVLIAAVAAVLLIACANVAGLLVARNASRVHEFAVRRALGASSRRLARQLLTESVLLGVLGGAGGLLVGAWLTTALGSLVPQDVLPSTAIALDGRVMIGAIALSIGAGLLFGALPAWQVRGGRTAAALGGRSRSASADLSSTRARSVLVVAELALAVVLIVTAVLLIRSFGALAGVNPGFNVNGVLAARIWLPIPNDASTGPYFTQEQQQTFYRRALDEIRTVSGVTTAAWSTWLPLGGGQRNAPYFVERTGEAEAAMDVEPFFVSDDYFRTMEIPLLAGRAFTPEDDQNAAGVMIISQSLADRYFVGDNPIGQRMYRDFGSGIVGPRFEIVGVVGDVHSGTLDREPPPQLYRSVWQRADAAMALLVRTSANPGELEAPIRDAITRIDPELPLFSVRPMSEVLAGTLATRRFATLLVGGFSGLALLLACVGIYGVISFVVTKRTNEIGVRVALGATPGDIIRMVVRNGLSMAAFGVACGLLVALALTRLIAGMLFQVSPLDPIAFGGSAAALVVVAVLASAIPARRAARVDPIDALRME